MSDDDPFWMFSVGSEVSYRFIMKFAEYIKIEKYYFHGINKVTFA